MAKCRGPMMSLRAVGTFHKTLTFTELTTTEPKKTNFSEQSILRNYFGTGLTTSIRHNQRNGGKRSVKQNEIASANKFIMNIMNKLKNEKLGRFKGMRRSIFEELIYLQTFYYTYFNGEKSADRRSNKVIWSRWYYKNGFFGYPGFYTDNLRNYLELGDLQRRRWIDFNNQFKAPFVITKGAKSDPTIFPAEFAAFIFIRSLSFLNIIDRAYIPIPPPWDF